MNEIQEGIKEMGWGKMDKLARKEGRMNGK